MAFAEPLPEPISASLRRPETGGTLTIDVAAIAANWRTLARRTRTAECAAVVKANAYGLGVEAVTSKLDGAGCKTFFVADLAEARRVRACARGAVIYVLGGFSPDIGPGYIDVGARPVINSTTELAEWDAFVAANNWRGGAAIHVDTGMNRLGIPYDRAVKDFETIAKLPGFTIEGVFTHFAMADEPRHSITQEQHDRFTACCDALQKAGHDIPMRHCANSAAIVSHPGTHEDLVRAGIMLYGYNPISGGQELSPVMSLKAGIVRCENIAKGSGVSYGHTWCAGQDSRIATISIGYADGLARQLSGRVQFLLHGKPVRQIGRICMDMCMLDITDFPEAQTGDAVTIIGQDGQARMDARDYAALLDTIPYEILCAVGKRVPRVYLQNGTVVKEACDIDFL